MQPEQPQINRSLTDNFKPLPAGLLFGAIWVLLFVLYYPAAKAGFVTDFTGWLDQVKNHAFREYINRSNFHAVSMYQFTQLLTYIYYKVFGINPWAWHLLFITLHTVNACLLYSFTYRLLSDTGVAKSSLILVTGVLLFCITPYLSEVIVWEPSFHFLTGLLFILLILRCVQEYVSGGSVNYVWAALLIYFFSLFTLEVFYITPWLVLALAFFYRHNSSADNKVVRYFFVPMLALFALRLAAFYALYGSVISRIGSNTVATLHFSSFGKPAKYLFHLLLVGRFWSHDTRQTVYDFCDSTAGIVLFYAVVVIIAAFIIVRFKSMNGKAKVSSLLFVYTLVTLALLVPVWFSESLLVLFDRYTYFTAAFFYMLLAVLISCIPWKIVRLSVIGLFALVNLRYAIMVSRYWGKSEKVISGLLHNIPEGGNKTTILLNLPESLNGTAMIGAEKNSEYKLMHDLLIPDHLLKNTVYDAMAYNMSTPTDGACVMVMNDSLLHVTLNQWGTWWWFEGKGGYSYETSDYKLNLVDAGHWYELILKKPADQYQLLYQVGDQWKTVDMSKRNVDQN